MIRKTGDDYVISSGHVWRPGSYESKRAANYAFRFRDEVLARLQKSVAPDNITFKMLQDERRRQLGKDE